MRVALCAEYPQNPDRVVGGIEEVTRRFAHALASRDGVEVHVVSFHQGQRPRSATEEIDGVFIHRRALPDRFGNVSMGRPERADTVAALREIDPDVVHPLGIGPKALAASESGLPWVVTVNGAQAAETRAIGGIRNRVRAAVFHRLEEESLRRAHTIIVPNPVVRALLGDRIRHARVFTIENAVDERFFDLPGGGDPRRVICVSRVIPHKRPELLVEAARRARATGGPFQVRWIGPADHEGFLDGLRAQVRDAGLEGAFEFVGFVSDDELRAEIAAAGLLVLPSAVEIAPISVMQGMAAGLPAIATDVGGTRHLVEDGRTGRLVPADDVEALATALRSTLDDPEGASAMGAAARVEARERFRVARVVDRTLEVYGTVSPRPGKLEATGSNVRNSLELRAITSGSSKPKEQP